MISVCTVTVLSDQLTSDQYTEMFPSLCDETYLVAIFILLRVHASTRSSIGGHGLIPVFSEVEDVFLFVIVYALDHLRPYQGAFSNNSLQRNHSVQVA